MENRAIVIKSQADRRVTISVIPGHFATTHSHINYYIDMTSVKTQVRTAQEAAALMASRYNTVPVDTIICMDGCEMIGGFMAQEMISSSVMSVNSGSDINVVTPEFNSNGQIIFRDNIQSMIWNKKVLLLIASATTGKTINRCLECIKYYGGSVAGVSAIFSAIDSKDGIDIHALFQPDDIPSYQSYSFAECPDCKEHHKIDAIVNSYGYSKI